jgi:hypothetical protein
VQDFIHTPATHIATVKRTNSKRRSNNVEISLPAYANINYATNRKDDFSVQDTAIDEKANHELVSDTFEWKQSEDDLEREQFLSWSSAL